MDVLQAGFDLILAKHFITRSMFLTLETNESTVKNVATRTFVHMLLRVAYLTQLTLIDLN